VIDVLAAPYAFCEATSDVLTAQGFDRMAAIGTLSTQHGF